MKKFNLKYLIMYSLAVFVALSSCSKDDKDDDDDKDETPEFETVSLTQTREVSDRIPEEIAQSSDPYASQCNTYITMATNMSAFSANMVPPENARVYNGTDKSSSTSDEYYWTWSYNSQSYTFIWSYEETSVDREWDLDIKLDGSRYDYMDAWELLDGSEGEIEFYYNWICHFDVYDSYETQKTGETCYDASLLFTWDTESDGTINYSYKQENLDGVGYLYVIDMSVAPNGAGTLDYYLNDELWYAFEWNAQGNGTWESYSGGELYETGSWTVK